MFSLWRNQKTGKCKNPEGNRRSTGVKEIFQKVPSPRQNRFYEKCMRFSSGKHFPMTVVKRTRMFISCMGQSKAGMTVEASLVLPLFLLFFVSLGSAIEMIRLHSNMELALYDTGKSMSIYGYAVTDGKEIGHVLSNFYAESQVIQYLGEEYLDESPIVGGAEGLDFSQSELGDVHGYMEIVVTYQVSPVTGMALFGDFRMMNRYYGHIWSGYKLPDGGVRGVVYIAENGNVYHQSKDCTHLSLSVRKTTKGALKRSNNNEGKRYLACDRCVREKTVLNEDLVYVTGEGDCFHIIRECPGLKRTVYAVPEAQKERFRPCSRCAYGNQK